MGSSAGKAKALKSSTVKKARKHRKLTALSTTTQHLLWPPSAVESSDIVSESLSQSDNPQSMVGPHSTVGGRDSRDSNDRSFSVTILALASIRGLGRKSLIALCDAFEGDLGKIWDAPPDRIRSVLEEARTPVFEKIAAEIENQSASLLEQGKDRLAGLERRNIHVIPFRDLPTTLRTISEAPRWLFVEGDPNTLKLNPTVAVVGTRRPSSHGITAASHVARQLASYPVTLVSGLAEGIDEEAHRASLQDNVKNVAFLGHGINMVFPTSTKELREQIVQAGGAIATEYLPDERYQRHYFVERNRLQAALSQLVIPVEANPKGGTAHTIRFARQLEKSIVGIKWPGANGILDELARNGYPLVDIFTAEGRRKLDHILRELVEQFNLPTYAFSITERRLRSEVKSRDVRASDIEQLIKSLREIAKDLDDVPNPHRRDI